MSNDANVTPAEEAAADQTAPWEEPVVGWLQRQPLVAALLAANTPLIAGLVAELAKGQTDAIVVALLGAAVAVLNIAGALAHRAVTPVAAPQIDDETPLVVAPAPVDEAA